MNDDIAGVGSVLHVAVARGHAALVAAALYPRRLGHFRGAAQEEDRFVAAVGGVRASVSPLPLLASFAVAIAARGRE